MTSRVISVRVGLKNWRTLERLGELHGTLTASQTILTLIDEAALSLTPGEDLEQSNQTYFPPVRRRAKRDQEPACDWRESVHPRSGTNPAGKCKDCEVLKNEIAFLYQRHGNVPLGLETHDKENPAETAVTPPAQKDLRPARREIPGEEPRPPKVVIPCLKISRDLAEFKHNMAYLMGAEPYSPPSTSPRIQTE